MNIKTRMNGQLPCQKGPTREASMTRRGSIIRIAKKKSSVMFSNIKMDLNFTSKSPILSIRKRLIMGVISRVQMIKELQRLSKEPRRKPF